MPERANGNPAAQIQKAFARDVVNVTALAMIEGEIESRVGRNHVPLILLPDVAQAIDLDRLHFPAHFHLHSTTSVPTPASVKISRRIECGTRPSTNCTFSTPL